MLTLILVCPKPGCQHRPSGAREDPERSKPHLPRYNLKANDRQVFTIHDNIRRKIASIIDAIPFLDKLLEETVDTLSVLIFATIEPILTPVLKQFKDVIYNGSAAVIDNNSQTEVFDDDNASDRTSCYLAFDEHLTNVKQLRTRSFPTITSVASC